MTLYATVRSERLSRLVRKGGDERLSIELTHKDVPQYLIDFTPEGLKVQADGGTLLDTTKTGK